MTRREAQEVERQAHTLLMRAAATLDLGRVPPALREDVGIESALLIKEILDRLPLNPAETIPGVRTVDAYRDSRRNEVPFRWQVPNTELEIVELRSGDNSGRLLFSTQSVGRAADFHARIADLPYRQESADVSLGYLSPATSPGFYDYYVATPGHLVPSATLLGDVVADLPGWLTEVRGGQAVFQWVGLWLGLLTALAAVVFTFWAIVFRARNFADPLDDWIRAGLLVLLSAFLDLVVDFANDVINVTGPALELLVTAGGAATVLLLAGVTYLVTRALAESVLVWRRTRALSVDGSRLRVGSQIFGFLAAAWVLVAGARELGADVVPLLAGLGIGGLAVALAAQKSIANYLGSLTLLANKPIREGDLVGFGDRIGTVEAIGLHATRIRTLERTQVTVPNASFSELQLENYSARDHRLLKTTLPLRFDTTVMQMRAMLDAVHGHLADHPKVLEDGLRVRFVGYSEHSKDIELFAYIDTTGTPEFLEIQKSLLLSIEEAINALGTTLAIPAVRQFNLDQDLELPPSS
ncbi:MAG: mechanosensitive ion channel domain-containing protein [Pseudomonadota bacterium]